MKLHKSLSVAFDCTFGRKDGNISRQAKRQWIAQGASGAAAFVLRAVRSGAAPFCVWVVRSRVICDYFPPALLSQAYRARRRALARLSPGLHTSRIQNVKSEARAELGMLAQRVQRFNAACWSNRCYWATLALKCSFILCPLVFPHLPHVTHSFPDYTSRCPDAALHVQCSGLKVGAKCSALMMRPKERRKSVFRKICCAAGGEQIPFCSVLAPCFHSPCGKTYADYVILITWYMQRSAASPRALGSLSPARCCIVGSLACNASAVCLLYWGAAWQFQLSRDALEGIST